MKKEFQIIIPMSGYGERFRRAGYCLPKPLIEIEGKPIVAHVIDMFPGESDFIFICNQDHLDEPSYQMQEILERYCPTGRVIGIAPHKLGPVHAVMQVEHLLDLDRPVIVNYCDFSCYWDWLHFKRWVNQTECDGAIPAYKGFHPHTLGTTNYAYIREHDGWVLDIQEKQPYTDNRMNEYASSGTYYYSNADIMLSSFRLAIAERLELNGEFYVSLTYKPMLAAGKKIGVYPLQHFMQWGTPEDVAEYNYWSSVFRNLLEDSHETQPHGSVIVPMAGLGERFKREGYNLTKPLITVSGKAMVLQATNDLPAAKRYVFVLRKDMQGFTEISKLLENSFPNVKLACVESITEGQACSVLIGLETIEHSDTDDDMITIGACDNGILYDAEKLDALINADSADIIVWGIRGYTNAVRHPEMYGWIDADVDGVIRKVSVKKAMDNPQNDPIVLGAFTFRRGIDIRRCVEELKKNNHRINGEYYLDSCINEAIQMGLRCVLFEVKSYLSWGTPNDLRTFNYWQSCFHLWKEHPYSLNKDKRISSEAASEMNLEFSSWKRDLPR